jgi:hypothetical protein
MHKDLEASDIAKEYFFSAKYDRKIDRYLVIYIDR